MAAQHDTYRYAIIASTLLSARYCARTMTRLSAFSVSMLLSLALLPLLLPAALSDVFQQQPVPPSPPPPLGATCTPLNDSSELVQAYGSQWVGLCAFSFCYQLYSTPFPNQDPDSLTTAMSGYLFANGSVLPAINLPSSAYGQANNLAYQILGAVGVRNQSQFPFDYPCSPTPTANINGVTSNNIFFSPLVDDLLLLGYPYFTLGGVTFDIDQQLYPPAYSESAFCTEWTVQVAQAIDPNVDEQVSLEQYVSPTSSLLWEFAIGTTNYAEISVSEHQEGSGTAYPTCDPYYQPPATSTVPFSYYIQQQLPNGLVQSSCVSGSLTVSGPCERYAGYQSYFAVNATGVRHFTDVHNRTTTQRILGIGLPTPITLNVVRNFGGSDSVYVYPLWPDNAINVDSLGTVDPNLNGILFQLDSVPYSGAVAIAETPYLLFARSANDGWVAEVAEIDQSQAGPGSWQQLYGNLGEIISSGGDGNFSLVFGSNRWNQSTVHSGTSCPVGVPSVSWTPGTTNYADPAGLTQVGFVYKSVIGYTTSGQPGTAICIAGIVTLDLLLPGDGQRALAANATGIRVLSTSAGEVQVSQLTAVPYWSYSVYQTGVPSYWYYNQSNPLINPAGLSSYGLMFNSVIEGQGGENGAYAMSLNWRTGLPGTTTGFMVEYEQFSGGSPLYQIDLPPTFTVVPLTSARPFVPSSYCPADTSALATAPGASSFSSNTLPQQQLSIAYSIVPNNFSPGNEWLVCANVVLILGSTSSIVGASSTSGPITSSFQAINASGLRAYVNLATGLGAISYIVGVASTVDLLALQPPADNLISLISPYISLSGLALRTSSAPNTSSGAYGPSGFALGLQQSFINVVDGEGVQFSQIANGLVETSSPDGSSSNSLYFTVGASTPQQQDCNAIVATLQANALTDSATITVPFSYSIVVTADATYEAWAVCVSGSLTLLSTPFYVSTTQPSVYVIQSVTGTRTYYNAWGQASTASIVAAVATTATDSNLYYPTATGNFFAGAGLTFTLNSSAAYNAAGLSLVSATMVTVSTSNTSGVLSVLESVGVFTSIVNATYTSASIASSSPTATLPVCPVVTYPASPPTTVLYFSFDWVSSGQSASICFQGALTVATQPVATVTAAISDSSSYTWYPVLAVSGSRVYTDLLAGQSYAQNITGLAAPFSVAVSNSATGAVVLNDNLLGVPTGSALSAASRAAVSGFGLALQFDAAPYYPTTGSYSNILTLQMGISGDGLSSVVDPNFTPDTTTAISLYATSTAAVQCSLLSNSSLAVPANTVYYWKVNGTIGEEAQECMTGTLQLGTALQLTGPGQDAAPVVAVTGVRYFRDSYTSQVQVAAITGVTSVAGYPNLISLTPPYLQGSNLSFGFGSVGLSFNTSILQPPNPMDLYDDVDSSSFDFTVLAWSSSGSVNELNQYGISSAVIQLTTDPSTAAGCNAASVQGNPVVNTSWVQVFYHIHSELFSLCGSLLLEYDLNSNPDAGGYLVVAVSGNRTWSLNGGPTQVQTVLTLAPIDSPNNDNVLYTHSCPPLDVNGLTFTTSCPSCLPAQQSLINVYIDGGQCGGNVYENSWYQQYSGVVGDLTLAPYTPGQPLQYQCPTGVPAAPGGGSPSGGTVEPLLGLLASASYQFAYAVQGAALNILSATPNWYGNWSVIVNGSVLLAATLSNGPAGEGYAIVGATGSRTYIDGTGAVAVQNIVGVSLAQPSYVYPPASSSFIDSMYGWALLLDGSVATPTGPALSNVLYLLQSGNSTISPAALTVTVSTQSIAEMWLSGRSNSSYFDSVLLQPLVLSNSSSDIALALGSLVPTLLSAAAARAQASILPASSVSSSLQVYFQYRVSLLSAVAVLSPFWQVCATGTLTVDTTRGAAVEGSVRYPVISASGVRTVTLFADSYFDILAGLINGTDNTSITPATSVVQTITGAAAAGAQGADNRIAFTTMAANGSFPISLTNAGLGLLLSAPAVYANGTSWSQQVTLSLSANNQDGVPLGTFALGEAWGPQSVGLLVGSTSSPQSCPAAAVSGAAILPPAQTYLLVYSLTYNTTASMNTPATSCLVAEVTVSGLGVDTALGPAYAIVAVSGFHYASYSNGGSDTQPLNSSVSTSYVQFLYPSAQSPALVDSIGLSLQAFNLADLTYSFFYNTATSQYVELGNGGTLLSSNVYLLPASELSAVPVGQAACSYSPTAFVPVSSSSSSAAGSGSSAASAGSAASSAATASSAVPASTTSTAAVSSTSTMASSTVSVRSTLAATASTAVSSSSSSAAQPVFSSTSASSGGGGAAVQSSSSSFKGSIASAATSVTSSGASSSSAASPPASSSSSSSGPSHGAIAGIIIGCVGGALLILLVCLVLLLLSRSNTRKQASQTGTRSSDSSVVRPSVMAGEPSQLATVDRSAVRGGGEMEMQEI